MPSQGNFSQYVYYPEKFFKLSLSGKLKTIKNVETDKTEEMIILILNN